MGSAESSGRNGNNNSAGAGAVAGVAAAAAAVYGVCSFLASINNKEEGPMMKAPGQKGMDLFIIEIHHGGNFVSKPTLHYRGGFVSMFKDLDPNRMSFFELKGLVNDLGCKAFNKLYYRDLDCSFSSDYCHSWKS
ncbi:hypothetical protein LguiA_001660 [Lonicera macranthoides]